MRLIKRLMMVSVRLLRAQRNNYNNNHELYIGSRSRGHLLLISHNYDHPQGRIIHEAGEAEASGAGPPGAKKNSREKICSLVL